MAPIKEVTTSEEARAIMPQVNRFYNSLQEFKVNSAGSWLEAGEKIKFAKDKIKEIKAVRKDFLDPINELKETTLGFFEPALTKLEQIVDILGNKMADWRNKQLEIDRIAQEKADAVAREKERIERERLREEARKAQEEADVARKKAEELATKENFEKAERARLEAESKAEEASRLKEESKEVEIETKEVKSKAEKIEGLSFRRIWKFRIVNPGKVPIHFCSPDEVKIGKAVREYKDRANIPGVEIFFEDIPITTNGN